MLPDFNLKRINFFLFLEAVALYTQCVSEQKFASAPDSLMREDCSLPNFTNQKNDDGQIAETCFFFKMMGLTQFYYYL